MKIGLIGLNQTGKTSLFNLLTGKAGGVQAGGKSPTNIGTAFVPDARIDFLNDLYKPKKKTYAKIELTDVAGFSTSGGERGSGASRFLGDVRNCDTIVHVLRAFESAAVAHDQGTIDPVRDLEAVETEMLFADMEMIEKRIGRIKAGKKVTKEHEAEIDLLNRCFERLDKGGRAYEPDLSENERAAIKGFAFLTDLPRLAVVNLDERQLESGQWPDKEKLASICAGMNMPLIELCVDAELEISALPETDRQLFMDDMGIQEPGIARLARTAYELLGLISFLTVGGDEVRAWTIEKGTNAKSAAGKVHSDIERGFIRAEVVKYEHIFELGSMAKVKEKGLFRLEGKEYIVADGDIINYRFNV